MEEDWLRKGDYVSWFGGAFLLMTLERNLRISQMLLFFLRAGKLCSSNVQYYKWINCIKKKKLKIWDIVVIVTNLQVLTWSFQTQVFWAFLWKVIRKNNDRRRDLFFCEGGGSMLPLTLHACFLLSEEKE